MLVPSQPSRSHHADDVFASAGEHELTRVWVRSPGLTPLPIRTPATHRGRRRWIIALALAATCGALLLTSRVVIEHKIREQVLPAVARRLGAEMQIGDIGIGLGTVTLTGIRVAGATDNAAPLVTAERATVQIDLGAVFRGQAVVERIDVYGAKVTASRTDLERLAAARTNTSGGGGSSGGRLDLRRAVVTAHEADLELTDETGAGASVRAARIVIDASRTVEVNAESVTAWASRFAIEVTATDARLRYAGDRRFELGAARVEAQSTRTRLDALVRENPASNVTAEFADTAQGPQLSVAGAFSDNETWSLNAQLSPESKAATVTLQGATVRLARLGPLLERIPQLNAADTTVTGRAVVHIDATSIGIDADGSVADLNVQHPLLASGPISDVALAAELNASYDRTSGRLEISSAALTSGEVRYELSGEVLVPRETGERTQPRLAAHIAMPEVTCQQMLDSIPAGFVPELQGFQLSGRVSGELSVGIDWADLDATTLDWRLGMDGCDVAEAPEHASRLSGSFEHRVPVGDGWRTFVIGPDNPDFVPLTQVSRNLTRSLLTSEDSRFFRHDGFIVKEFRGALVKNLKRGRFAYGASSITMQVVKNVLLSRDKTVSRKFQELFLTWYVERTLSKERILEIYVNAIEFGPGVYGIKPAARQYFDKLPRRLNPVESAFFSSILPAPSRRYRQYCRGHANSRTTKKVDRILGHMLERRRLSEEEYALAIETPLYFRGNRDALCKQERRNGDNS